MVEIQLKPIHHVLVPHTVVGYLPRQGVGIGVVQRAECVTTGIIKHQLLPGQERKYGIAREKLVVEHVKTAGRAQMLALVHALGLAHGTIQRGCPKSAQLQKVTVFSESLKVVQTITHHNKYAPNSLREVVSTNDSPLIKRVIARVRRLSCRGIEVAIAVSSGNDRAGKKARTITRQKGRRACRSRCRLGLAHEHSVEEQETAVGD